MYTFSIYQIRDVGVLLCTNLCVNIHIYFAMSKALCHNFTHVHLEWPNYGVHVRYDLSRVYNPWLLVLPPYSFRFNALIRQLCQRKADISGMLAKQYIFVAWLVQYYQYSLYLYIISDIIFVICDVFIVQHTSQAFERASAWYIHQYSFGNRPNICSVRL